jgi:hypothetical protein
VPTYAGNELLSALFSTSDVSWGLSLIRTFMVDLTTVAL